MDHPYPYFAARWLWNRGRRPAALATLEDALRPGSGDDGPALVDAAALADHAGLDRFDTLVTWLLVSPGVLAPPVGAAFARLWAGAPVQPLVTALTVRHFPAEEADADGVAAIVAALGAAADDGALSGHSEDFLLGGRAVLALATIDGIAHPWDGLGRPLRPRLAGAYARAGDPWAGWRADRPAEVLARGLDTLIGQHQPGAEIDTFWRGIRHGHPAFADAFLAVLDRAEVPDGVGDLRRFVELHADLDAVDDPGAWLAALHRALVDGDLAGLALPRG